MKMYHEFANIYDRLMNDIAYDQWADYIEEIFNQCSIKPTLVLDLGCGTGNMTLELAKRGYDMIGVEQSEDMLGCAVEKSDEMGQNVLWLNQSMCGFELYGTVGAIISTLDCVNYITRTKDLRNMLSLVHNYLDENGLFIFDINTKYKFEEILGNNTFHEIREDVAYIWQSGYNGRKKICSFDLTFFVRNDNGSYDRFDEYHEERMYTKDELTNHIEQSGLKLLATYHDLSFRKDNNKSDRIFFVCQKKGE